MILPVGATPDFLDPDNLRLVCGVVGLLSVASLVGWRLSIRTSRQGEAARRTVANLNARLRAWWVIVAVCTVALLLGRVSAAILFGLVSWQALREWNALTPARADDRRVLTWATWTLLPLQYGLAVSGWLDVFPLLIPVGFLALLPPAMLLTGDTENFLERVALPFFGWMVCVFSVSHAPALLALPLPHEGPRLLAFFLLVVELSDVFQYVWGKLCGRRPIAPRVSPNKTWEGFVGGVGSATLLGTGLWWVTPFPPWQAAGLSLVIALLGFAGGLTMSAIKRDRGVKDYGTLIQGHGGVLDRVDSLCFAAPVFFHLTRCCFT